MILSLLSLRFLIKYNIYLIKYRIESEFMAKISEKRKKYVNTRILSSHLTGVQRYTRAILSRFPADYETVSPSSYQNGALGHLWEQALLPLKIRDNVLWSPSNAGPLALRRQVVTIHDLVPIDHPEWLNARFSAWYQFLTPRLVNAVQIILTDSHASKARIVHHYPKVEDKVRVIHIGVDSHFHPRSASQVNAARAQLGIPFPHYILALGSLEPRKNLVRLLQAWSIIQSSIPDDVWLVIAGAKGKSMVFGEVSFDKLPPRVHLCGHVSDELLPALYSGAIAAPYLSVYEGFGLPPLEAMACGTPPLTGNLTSLPEVVGKAGLMVDPFDVEAIADALKQLIEQPSLRKRLSEAGLERARLFSWQKTADLTWSAIDEVARAD